MAHTGGTISGFAGTVISMTSATAPTSPASGAKYVAGTVVSSTDAWYGCSGKIMEWKAPHSKTTTLAWVASTPVEGTTVYDATRNAQYVYTGSVWAAEPAAAYTWDAITGAVSGATALTNTLADTLKAGVTTAAVTDHTAKNTITVQLKDYAGTNLAVPGLVKVWLAATAFAAPSATGNAVVVDTGTTVQAILANGAYDILTDATGVAELTLTVAAGGERYAMVAVGGKVIASSKMTLVSEG